MDPPLTFSIHQLATELRQLAYFPMEGLDAAPEVDHECRGYLDSAASLLDLAVERLNEQAAAAAQRSSTPPPPVLSANGMKNKKQKNGKYHSAAIPYPG